MHIGKCYILQARWSKSAEHPVQLMRGTGWATYCYGDIQHRRLVTMQEVPHALPLPQEEVGVCAILNAKASILHGSLIVAPRLSCKLLPSSVSYCIILSSSCFPASQMAQAAAPRLALTLEKTSTSLCPIQRFFTWQT